MVVNLLLCGSMVRGDVIVVISADWLRACQPGSQANERNDARVNMSYVDRLLIFA